LGLEPDETESLVARRNRYLRLEGDEHREFYCRKLLHDVASSCRDHVGAERSASLDWLVTIVSGSPELALLACAVLTPRVTVHAPGRSEGAG
jgi:hypothetical protein